MHVVGMFEGEGGWVDDADRRSGDQDISEGGRVKCLRVSSTGRITCGDPSSFSSSISPSFPSKHSYN